MLQAGVHVPVRTEYFPLGGLGPVVLAEPCTLTRSVSNLVRLLLRDIPRKAAAPQPRRCRGPIRRASDAISGAVEHRQRVEADIRLQSAAQPVVGDVGGWSLILSSCYRQRIWSSVK
jgi:hypothetical protein